MEINIKDKIVFFCGHDYDDKWKINLLVNFKKFSFSFGICPSNWKTISYSTDGKRFCNREIFYILILSIFEFTYIDNTGTDIIHMIIDEELIYYPIDMNKNVDKFKAILRHNIDYEGYDRNAWQYSLFDLQFSEKPNGKYIYYLTVRNDSWWIEHQLGNLLSQRYPDCYLSKEDIDYYFPEFHDDWIDRRYIKIPYKRLDIYENQKES